MLESVRLDTKHSQSSNDPVPADGAEASAMGYDAVLRPGPLDALRSHESHIVAVVCADVETGAPADYKTGKSAVILSRR